MLPEKDDDGRQVFIMRPGDCSTPTVSIPLFTPLAVVSLVLENFQFYTALRCIHAGHVLCY